MSGPVSTGIGDSARVQFPVPDIISVYNQLLGPTQPSILPGSVNEDQPQLGRKRQVWIIPLADERGECR